MKVTNTITGSTMTVDDEVADRLGPEWEPVKESAKKSTSRSAKSDSDDEK